MTKISLCIATILLLLLVGCSQKTVNKAEPINDLPTRSIAREDIVILPESTPAPTPTPTPVPLPREAKKVQFKRNANQLGHHETYFDATDINRGTNISLAAASINGQIVQPNEIFSYNKTIGSTTAAYGYKQSVIYVSGKKAISYGGGVCQVSTTLCNAAMNANMTIIERHDHSAPVTYAKAGKEAATSHNGNLDFRFQNDNDYPVIIHASVDDGRIFVRINKV